MLIAALNVAKEPKLNLPRKVGPQSHLLLLVYKIVAGHNNKVVPPSEASSHCHVLLLQRKDIIRGFAVT